MFFSLCKKGNTAFLPGENASQKKVFVLSFCFLNANVPLKVEK